MTQDIRDVLKLALEALKDGDWYINQLEMIVYCVDNDEIHFNRAKVQTAIKVAEEALAQTQEPVSSDPLPRACNLAGVDYQTFLKIKAYMPVTPPQRTEPKIGCVNHDCDKCKAQRTWVGLTDEEMYRYCPNWLSQSDFKAMMLHVEAKLKQKNGYAEENT